jgi:hypothetical protein
VSALGLLAVSPEVTDAARKDKRRDGNQERNNDDAEGKRDDGADGKQRERESGQRSDGSASAEDRDTGNKSEKSEKRDRDDRREDDQNAEQGESEGGRTRGESSRRDADSDSNSGNRSSADDDSDNGGGRRVREFEQEADEPAVDTPATTTVTPANPNVDVGDIPTTSIADLVVEANDDVIATVSTSGGFAFARSEDVIAVTGPDGATIIQTGDVTTGTSDPTEPSDDGGYNDLDFSS